jgi:tetratricopeptide (TPR) repeat protein
MEQLFGEFATVFEAGERVARFGQVDDEARIKLEIALASESPDPAPAGLGVGELTGTADEGDAAVAERQEMLESGASSLVVIDDHGADAVGFEFAADDGSGNVVLFEIGEEINVDKEPVGEDDEAFDAAIEHHFEIALEAAAIVVDVGEDGKERRLVEGILDSAKNQGAVGVGHVEDHDSHGVAAPAAQRAGKKVGTVSQLRGGALDAGFSGVGNVARKRRVVEDDGNGRRGEATSFGNVADSDGRRVAAAAGVAAAGFGFCARFGHGFRRGFWRTCGAPRGLRIVGFHGLLEFSTLAGGHYSTVNRVSSMGIARATWVLMTILLVYLTGGTGELGHGSAMEIQAKTNGGDSPSQRDPKKLFAAGEAALRAGRLDEAERDFRQVLAIQPGVAGAYANLGVISMRRKQWAQALEMLHKGEALAPEMAGIRLNIGLVYFRQNEFAEAIAPFQSVVKQAPDSYQARYLLGLCYFFTDRWTDAIGTLQPLWAQASDQLNYLYVLGIAAYKTKDSALEEKALGRLVEIGQNSAEYHLLMGKAHLNRGEYEDAVKELEAAEKADPKLPFVHFNLGLAYLRKQDYDRARAEFHKDVAVEPDMPYSYEQLGGLEATAGNEDEAAKNYRAALKQDPNRVDSLMGLGKIEEQRQHYAEALADLDRVIAMDDRNAAARYMRGQVLLRLGREKDGRQELAQATKMLNEQREARHQELEGETVPSPEVAREPQ